jgi:hypothetical protein
MRFRLKNGRRNKIVSIEKLLPEVIKELNMSEAFLMGNIKNSWRKIIGDIISTHSIPDRIFKNILFVAVDHPAYSNEIIMMKNELMKKLKNEFTYAGIRDIRVEIRKLNWKKTGDR